MSTLRERYRILRKDIRHLAATAEIPIPELCVVSKYQPVDKILQLYEEGHRVFGENYVNEMFEKAAQLPKDIQFVMIGHLQSNKISKLLDIEQLCRVETVDSSKLATKLDQASGAARPGQPLEVLIQVNTSEEASKSGLPMNLEDVRELALHILTKCPNLTWKGFMTIGNPEPTRAAENFRALRILGDELLASFKLDKVENLPAQLFHSMGMTDDMGEAIANGTSQLRIGTAIMGPRPSL